MTAAEIVSALEERFPSAIKGKSLEAIFGQLDAMKFRSSVEIFDL